MPTEQFFSYILVSEINWNSPAEKTSQEWVLVLVLNILQKM
jgi:hypothetical protein